jgi:Tfp pilus assembly protein PilX
MIHCNRSNPRRGLMVIAVLVCLVVMILLGAALLKMAILERQNTREGERRLQAEWLVESGLARARARLAADSSYAGENWTLGEADLGLPESPAIFTGAGNGDRGGGVVTITVDRSGAGPRRRVRVQADYPRDGPHHSRHSEEVFINLEPQKSGATP